MECPKCGYVMDEWDKECRRCRGEGLPQDEPQALPEKSYRFTTDRPVAPVSRVGAVVALVLVCTPLAIAIVVLRSGGAPDSDEQCIIKRAKEIVLDELVCPATARFSETRAMKDGNEWYVRGTVDAQNAHGAMERGTFDVFFDCSAEGYLTDRYPTVPHVHWRSER